MIYFNTELLNLILNDKKQVPEWNFRKKIACTAIFGQKSTFLAFFKKHPFQLF
jgi:hypothetical protein